MKTSSPMQQFYCAECDARAVSVSGPLTPDAVVVCGECGASICTYADLLEGLSKAQEKTSHPARRNPRVGHQPAR